MQNFITNTNDKSLRKRLHELIVYSKELNFLTGFFYFSGVDEIFTPITKNKDLTIKILVGLQLDRMNYEVIETAGTDNLSNDRLFLNYVNSLKMYTDTDDFDKEETQNKFNYFLSLLENGQLEIRKTFRPNHAKLYIFKLREKIPREALFITGSSNLTRSGVLSQDEFNVEISDYGTDQAIEYFNSLWEEAAPITEDDAKKDKLIKIIKKETPLKEITPFEAYVLLLKAYFDSMKPSDKPLNIKEFLNIKGYNAYKYQLDAVNQALDIINSHNGVIIADVVGLGKTIVACMVAKQLNKRGIVVSPPGLVGDKQNNSGWKGYLEDFELYSWEARSIGDLENVYDFVSKREDIEVVIIDEAHRFRNQDTKSYEYLKNICRGKIVVLLTATPFNNRPSDILSLLKLFISPKKSSITLDNNLLDRFRTFKSVFEDLSFIYKYRNSSDEDKRKKTEALFQKLFGYLPIDIEKVKERSHYIARQIRDIIEPVTIRRNRLDLLHNSEYKSEINELSKVSDPKEWFFELSAEQSSFYDLVIKDYFGDPDNGGLFKGAIYRPYEYEVSEKNIEKGKEAFQYYQQKNLYDFMRRLLVKRFESSFGAFKQSIKNFINILEVVMEFIDKTGNYILDRVLLEKIYELDVEQIEDALNQYARKMKEKEYPKNHRVYDIKKFKNKEKFLEDIKSDYEMFKEILSNLDKLDLVSNDPKLKSLINNIEHQFESEENHKRKIIIFSEYTDTVKYIEPVLKKHFKGRVLTVHGLLGTKKLREIYENFDASQTVSEQKDDYDILLSTDKISEGFNLNRAGMIINYDIPWNPVRVIQRVGRINRINKKVFDELYVVNFFPTEKGSQLVKSREIASNKMYLIHNALGEDSKIFDIDEEPTPSKLYERIQTNPEDIEGESFYTKILNEFEEIREKHSELAENVSEYPKRLKVAKKYVSDEQLVFFKKHKIFIHYADYENDKDPVLLPFEDAIEKIKCDEKEERQPFSEYFWDYYEKIKNIKEKKAPLTDQSNEKKAYNNLKSMTKKPFKGLEKHLPFIDMLLEDLSDFGTLPDYTLRRIANLKLNGENNQKKTIREIEKFKKELGEHYLDKEKLRLKDTQKELILAVENRKMDNKD